MNGANDEYPPLLPLGFHPMDLAGLGALCVARFPDSLTRPAIMDGLKQVIDRLNHSALPMEVWVNGSFLTEKLNPRDVDMVAKVKRTDIAAATPVQIRTLTWFARDDLRTPYQCDTYIFLEFEAGHQLADVTAWSSAYWLKQLGFSRAEEPKGLAVLNLPFVIV